MTECEGEGGVGGWRWEWFGEEEVVGWVRSCDGEWGGGRGEVTLDSEGGGEEVGGREGGWRNLSLGWSWGAGPDWD